MRFRRLIGDLIRKRNPLDIEHICIPIDVENFSSLKIAHVSDIHIPRPAFSPREIADAVKKQTPDIIFLTGDIMDGRLAFDGARISLLISLLLDIAPVFAVSGNHERGNNEYYRIWKTMLKLQGVHYLENDFCRLEKGGARFLILGVEDFSFRKIAEMDFSFLSDLVLFDQECLLMLHHKPYVWRGYFPADAPVPRVVFSGHAHGGQVGLPFFKRGLIAPHQGFFPKYVTGRYDYEDGSVEVVSRGLTSATRPIRINNKPHIPIVELVGSKIAVKN